MVPNMAVALAHQVMLGKRCLLVTGTQENAAKYYQAIGRLCVLAAKRLSRPPPVAKGQITVLCAKENNGSEWKKERFDCMEADEEALEFPAGRDLIMEASLRVVGDGTPSLVDKKGRKQWITGFDKNGRPE
jgi:hypothetical protein